jgi:hypothetical protein
LIAVDEVANDTRGRDKEHSYKAERVRSLPSVRWHRQRLAATAAAGHVNAPLSLQPVLLSAVEA